MSKLLSEADFMEADITYKASVEFEYLFNAVVFNYTTLRCKRLIHYLTLMHNPHAFPSMYNVHLAYKY